MADDLHPALQAFQEAFTTPESQEWAGAVTGRVQQFMDVRDAHDQAQAAGNAMVLNMQHARDNLTDMARNDPTTAPLALDLAPAVVNGMVSTHPGLSPDQHEGIAGPLVDHFRGEIAHAAVKGFADVDADAARSALDKYKGFIPEADHAPLNSYIDAMDGARQQDSTAQQYEGRKDQAIQSDSLSATHFSRLVDSDGTLTYPADWAKDMMRDDRVMPEHRAALAGAYGRLQANGDVPESDPNVVRSMVSRMASGDMPAQQDVLGHVGSRLSASDAAWMMGQQDNPGTRRDMQALQASLDAGRSKLAPNLDAAELSSFGRYTNWLLPTFRAAKAAGGLDVLNPNSKDSIYGASPETFWRSFRQSADHSATPPSGDRPPLNTFFGG